MKYCLWAGHSCCTLDLTEALVASIKTETFNIQSRVGLEFMGPGPSQRTVDS